MKVVEISLGRVQIRDNAGSVLVDLQVYRPAAASDYNVTLYVFNPDGLASTVISSSLSHLFRLGKRLVILANELHVPEPGEWMPEAEKEEE